MGRQKTESMAGELLAYYFAHVDYINRRKAEIRLRESTWGIDCIGERTRLASIIERIAQIKRDYLCKVMIMELPILRDFYYRRMRLKEIAKFRGIIDYVSVQLIKDRAVKNIERCMQFKGFDCTLPPDKQLAGQETQQQASQGGIPTTTPLGGFPVEISPCPGEIQPLAS